AARCPGAASAALVTAGAAAVGVAGGKARRLAVDGLRHALVAEGELGAHARRREVARVALVARGAAERVAADAREAAEVEAPAVRARLLTVAAADEDAAVAAQRRVADRALAAGRAVAAAVRDDLRVAGGVDLGAVGLLQDPVAAGLHHVAHAGSAAARAGAVAAVGVAVVGHAHLAVRRAVVGLDALVAGGARGVVALLPGVADAAGGRAAAARGRLTAGEAALRRGAVAAGVGDAVHFGGAQVRRLFELRVVHQHDELRAEAHAAGDDAARGRGDTCRGTRLLRDRVATTSDEDEE